MIKKSSKKIVIPLASWSEADCITAIDELTAKVGEGVARCDTVDELRALFVRGSESFDEQTFFTAVGKRFPGAAPAIRRLIGAYADAADTRYRALFWNAEEGIGIFGHAVLALGVLDHSALQTIRRYGYHVDGEHERFFARETVPAIVRAHGWSDNVIEFVAWVVAHGFDNSLTNYSEVWSGWGWRDAVVRRYRPEAFAQRVAAEIAAIELWRKSYRKPRARGPMRYGSTGTDQLARDLPQPHEPWVEAFFLELERIARGKQEDAAGRGATRR